MVLGWKRLVVRMHHFFPTYLASVYPGPRSSIARIVKGVVFLMLAALMNELLVPVKCHCDAPYFDFSLVGVQLGKWKGASRSKAAPEEIRARVGTRSPGPVLLSPLEKESSSGFLRFTPPSPVQDGNYLVSSYQLPRKSFADLIRNSPIRKKLVSVNVFLANLDPLPAILSMGSD